MDPNVGPTADTMGWYGIASATAEAEEIHHFSGRAITGETAYRDEHHRLPEQSLKIGIVSDVHCNEAGLRRALDILADADELICLGDSIYEYRFSNEVVRLLKARDAHTIVGNHEEGFLGPHGQRARQPDWIDRGLLRWLGERSKRLELAVGGKKILAVHSTPWEPQGSYVYPHSAALTRFAEADADFTLYGHTHHQLVRRIGKVLVINPGSAGEARDEGNGRQLSCAMLDTATEEVIVTNYPEEVTAC